MGITVSVTSDVFPAYLTALATFLAVLVALFGPMLHRWLYRPRLVIEFKPEPPFRRVARLEPPFDVGYWFRVRVRNRGRGTAHQCRLKVIDVSDASGKLRTDLDPMLLRWSSMPLDLEFRPLDLPPQDDQLADVLVEPVRGGPGIDPPQFLTVRDVAPGHETTLRPGSTHYLLLGVSCEEGYARLPLKVEVEEDGAVNVAVDRENYSRGDWAIREAESQRGSPTPPAV